MSFGVLSPSRASARSASGRLGLSLIAGAALASVLFSVAPARAELDEAMRLASFVPVDVVGDSMEPAGPQVIARIDISEQTMYVYVGEQLVHAFKVSTGRSGYTTPVGRYQALWLASRWRSRKYHNAPMPWSVFFDGGYAIHGTTEVRRLGRPASHGCIRLHPDDAKVFFTLVQASGRENTLIAVVR
jgi:hypothetical protein